MSEMNRAHNDVHGRIWERGWKRKKRKKDNNKSPDPDPTTTPKLIAHAPIIFMAGTLVTVRSGRSTRNVRSALSPPPAPEMEIQPMATTAKSSQFHASRRYAPLCRTNPKPMILGIISSVKAMLKNHSE